MKVVEKLIMLMASGFNAGYISIAPGTFGAVLGLPICFFLSKMDLMPGLLAVSAFTLFAIWVAGRAQTISGIDDPGCIVIDEIAGMMVTLLGLPFNLATVVTGFITFRALDILKPVPIRNLDRRITGGLGVVADDVAAGIMANLILRGLFYLITT